VNVQYELSQNFLILNRSNSDCSIRTLLTCDPSLLTARINLNRTSRTFTVFKFLVPSHMAMFVFPLIFLCMSLSYRFTCRGAHETISRRADSISNSFRLVNETSQLVSTKGPELEGWIRDRLVKNRASSLARLQLVSRLEFVQLVSQYNFNNYEYKFI
jgi:hypothetical protein